MIFHVLHITILVYNLVELGIWVIQLDFTLMPTVFLKVFPEDGTRLVDLLSDGFGFGSSSSITL